MRDHLDRVEGAGDGLAIDAEGEEGAASIRVSEEPGVASNALVQCLQEKPG